MTNVYKFHSASFHLCLSPSRSNDQPPGHSSHNLPCKSFPRNTPSNRRCCSKKTSSSAGETAVGLTSQHSSTCTSHTYYNYRLQQCKIQYSQLTLQTNHHQSPHHDLGIQSWDLEFANRNMIKGTSLAICSSTWEVWLRGPHLSCLFCVGASSRRTCPT